MPTEGDVVRLLIGYQEVWFSHFPLLSRRAEWHILHHLCTKGRNGAPVGELYGLVKQVFLLDDSTVKDRILSISETGLCDLDPPGQVFSRTVATPARELLAKFDAHLRDFIGKLAEAAGNPGLRGPITFSPADRIRVLRPLQVYQEHWGLAVDAVFDQGGLSPARRNDAKRHLISSSHWNLLHAVLRWEYDAGRDGHGVLADRLAAQLLQLTGQTLQTTRDHIGYLIEIGIFQRLKGRAMHVALSEPARLHLGLALHQTAMELPPLLHAVVGDMLDDPTERTLNRKPAPPKPRHFLQIVAPVEAAQRFEVHPPLTLGRTAPSDLLLASSDISRLHCRLDSMGDRLVVLDLDSTNGTFVNDRQIDAATTLATGDRLRLGSYILHYDTKVDSADVTQLGQVGAPPGHESSRGAQRGHRTVR